MSRKTAKQQTVPSKKAVLYVGERQVGTVLDELIYLYTKQMERIEIDVATEKHINKLMPTTGKEIQIAVNLLVLINSCK